MSRPGGPDPDSDVGALVRELAGLCDRDGLKLAVAESCTGGSLAAAITDLPGVSSFFVGGVVTYSNELKEALLGVPADVLEAHGAVSEPTARAMAAGVRSRLAVDVGISVTGIAGPDGATETKPVGLVYVAVDSPAGLAVRRDVWPGDRASVRRSSVRAALELALQQVRVLRAAESGTHA